MIVVIVWKLVIFYINFLNNCIDIDTPKSQFYFVLQLFFKPCISIKVKFYKYWTCVRERFNLNWIAKKESKQSKYTKM